MEMALHNSGHLQAAATASKTNCIQINAIWLSNRLRHTIVAHGREIFHKRTRSICIHENCKVTVHMNLMAPMVSLYK